MIRCQLDSGSATDCQPLCSAPATKTVTYRSGCSVEPFVVALCGAHVRRFENQIWPDRGVVNDLKGVTR
jgi:hypothetical protein